MSLPTQMLSIRLKQKWHAIIATAGAARRRMTGRSGPTVRVPGGRARVVMGAEGTGAGGGGSTRGRRLALPPLEGRATVATVRLAGRSCGWTRVFVSPPERHFFSARHPRGPQRTGSRHSHRTPRAAQRRGRFERARVRRPRAAGRVARWQAGGVRADRSTPRGRAYPDGSLGSVQPIRRPTRPPRRGRGRGRHTERGHAQSHQRTWLLVGTRLGPERPLACVLLG